MMTLSSKDPVARRLDFGLNATLSTGAVWPLSTRSGGERRKVSGGSPGVGTKGKTRAVPSSEAVAKYSESGETERSLMPGDQSVSAYDCLANPPVRWHLRERRCSQVTASLLVSLESKIKV